MASPQYVGLNGFTVVLTPHFLDALRERAHLLCGAAFNAPHWNKIWLAIEANQTFGYKLGMGYAYCRAKYNTRRDRWELEYISFTPADAFHTRSKTFAKYLEVA